MLVDTDAGKKLAEFGAQSEQNRNIVEQFGQWLKELLNKLRSIFRNVEPDSLAAKEFQKFDANVKQILADMFVDMSLDAGEKLSTIKAAGMTEKITTYEGGVKSKNGVGYDYSKSFAEQIDDYKAGNIPKGDTLVVGGTPEVFRKIGMIALPMTINTTHIDYALNGTKDFDHHLGEALLKQLPEAIKKPVAIMTSGTKANSSIVAMLEIRHNGKQVVVPIVVDGFGRQNGIHIDSNAVTSVYGKDYSISKVLYDAIVQEANGQFRLYYLDKNKATALLQKARVLMPKSSATSNGGFIHSIRESGSPVNMKFQDVTETQQFKRWFGDWMKHPNKASKIVNSDGTPMIMYHGSPAQFTIFDKKKAKSSGQYGRGFYFTNSQSHAGTYGQQYSVYLNIRNPLQQGTSNVSRAQVLSFLEAVAENEDYSIENYGNYDVDSVLQNIMGKAATIDAFQVIQDISLTAIGDMVEAAELFNKVNGTKYDGIVAATETVAFEPNQIKSATDNIGTFDGNNPDIRYKLPVASGKNFKNGQNAKGEFVANILIDLADSNSEWWTGRYNRGILGMSKTDDTEFRQFHQEIEKRTKDMEEYSEAAQAVVTDAFTVRDGKGNEYIYRVELDGYLHGVVQEKVNKKKFEATLRKETVGGNYGQSDADIKRRARDARAGMERTRTGDGRSVASRGTVGSGGMGGRTSPSNQARYDSRGQSVNQTVHDTAGSNDLILTVWAILKRMIL